VSLRLSCAKAALLLAVTACGEPAPASTSVDLVSEAGLVAAHVQFVGPVERGDNALLVELTARQGEGTPRLLAVDAVMPAHTHEAHAASIEASELGFRASKLNLYMTGRWHLELALELAQTRDSVSLPVDVP
jgi:hypothetical protein